MSANPYLIPTGAMFGSHKLKESYAYSQVLEISNILSSIISKNTNYFSDDDFKQYVICRKLIENLQSLMKKKLDEIPEYRVLISNFSSLTTKMDKRVRETKEVYDAAMQALKDWDSVNRENKTNKNIINKSSQGVVAKLEQAENYRILCGKLELFDLKRRKKMLDEILYYNNIFNIET